jgi:hypothetical protein
MTEQQDETAKLMRRLFMENVESGRRIGVLIDLVAATQRESIDSAGRVHGLEFELATAHKRIEELLSELRGPAAHAQVGPIAAP